MSQIVRRQVYACGPLRRNFFFSLSRSPKMRYRKAGFGFSLPWELVIITITVDATYENGTLRLDQPLPLKEHEKVRVSVQTQPGTIMEAYGIIGWKGNHATL